MNPMTTNGSGGPVAATEAVRVPAARPAGPAGEPLPDGETEAARLEARFRALGPPVLLVVVGFMGLRSGSPCRPSRRFAATSS
jgi:hypothetical protein